MSLYKTITKQQSNQVTKATNSPKSFDKSPASVTEGVRLPQVLSQSNILQLQKAIGNRAVAQLLESKLNRMNENRTDLPDNIKSGVENLSGLDMSDIRVHYNSSKPASLGALAYTKGSDIHIAPGQEKHLPHEAWHVAQQMEGRVSPTLQTNGVSINDNTGLEHEADVMGVKISNLDNDTEGSAKTALTTRISYKHGEAVQGVFGDEFLELVKKDRKLRSVADEYVNEVHSYTPEIRSRKLGLMKDLLGASSKLDEGKKVAILRLIERELTEISQGAAGAGMAPLYSLGSVETEMPPEYSLGSVGTEAPPTWVSAKPRRR